MASRRKKKPVAAAGAAFGAAAKPQSEKQVLQSFYAAGGRPTVKAPAKTQRVYNRWTQNQPKSIAAVTASGKYGPPVPPGVREDPAPGSRELGEFPDNADDANADDMRAGDVGGQSPNDVLKRAISKGAVTANPAFGPTIDVAEATGAGAVIGSVADAFFTGVGWVFGQVDEHVYRPWNAATSAAAIITNPNSSVRNPVDAYNLGYTLSPGQAVAANPLSDLPEYLQDTSFDGIADAAKKLTATGHINQPTQGSWGEDVEDERAAGGLREYRTLDPGDPAQLERMLWLAQNDPQVKGLTGSYDAAQSILNDPLVWGGKGVKAGRGAMLGVNWLKSVGGKAGAVKVVDRATEIANAAKGAAGKVDDVAFGPQSRIKAPTTAAVAADIMDATRPGGAFTGSKQARVAERRAQALARQITWMAGETRTQVLMKNKLIENSSNPEALAGLVSDAKTPDEVGLLIKAVGFGDEGARSQLAETRAFVSNTIDEIDAHDRWLGDLTTKGRWQGVSSSAFAEKLGKFENVEEEKAFVQSYLDDLRTYSSELDALLRPEHVGAMVPKQTLGQSGVSPFTRVEDWKLNRAERRGKATFNYDLQEAREALPENGWNVSVIQHNAAAMPVRVIRWTRNQRPTGHVSFEGVSNPKKGNDEVVAWLNRADWLDARQKSAFYDRIIKKQALSPSDAVAEAHAVERDIMVAKAVEQGMVADGLGPRPVAPDRSAFFPREAMTPEQQAAANATVQFVGPQPAGGGSVAQRLNEAVPQHRSGTKAAFAGYGPPAKPVAPPKPTLDTVTAQYGLKKYDVPLVERRQPGSAFEQTGMDMPGGAAIQHEVAKPSARGFKAASDGTVQGTNLREGAMRNAREQGWIRPEHPDRRWRDNTARMIDDTRVGLANDARGAMLRSNKELQNLLKVEQDRWRKQVARDREFYRRDMELFNKSAAEGRDYAEARWRLANEKYELDISDWRSVRDEYRNRNEKVKEWADEVNHWQTQRDNLGSQVDDKGYYIDEDGALSVVPGWETQLKGSTRLMDWDRFKAIADGYAGKNRRHGLKSGAYGTWKIIDNINYVANSIYRPMVLLSLRYTMRNVFESTLRAMAVAGAGAFDPNTIRAISANAGTRLGRAVGNPRRLAKARDNVLNDLYGKKGASGMAAALRAEYDSLSNLGPDDLDQLEGLAKTFDQIAAQRDEVYGRLEGVTAREQKLRGDLENIQKKLDVYEVGKKYAGSYDVTTGGATLPGMIDPKAGIPPEIMTAALSADNTAQMVFNIRAQANYNSFKNAAVKVNTRVKQGDKGYFAAQADWLNNTLRTSPVARMQINGTTDAQFLRYMKNTPEGAQLRQFVGELGMDVSDDVGLLTWFNSGARNLRLHFPDGDDILRRIADGGRVSERELAGRYKNTKLPDIVGTQIIAEYGLPSRDIFRQWYHNATSTAFRVLGSTPETAMGRRPLGGWRYKQAVAEQVAFHGPEWSMKNADVITRNARLAAVRDVRDIQYTVDNYSNLARALEPIAPFTQAQFNSTRTWMRLIAHNPSILGRAHQTAQAGIVTDDVETYDEQGNPRIEKVTRPRTFDIPVGDMANGEVPMWAQAMGVALPWAGSLNNLQGGTEFRVRPVGIFSVIANPNPQLAEAMGMDSDEMRESAAAWAIGAFAPQLGGPWISPAASELRKALDGREDLNTVQTIGREVGRILAPQGASNSPLSVETLTPMAYRNAAALVMGEDNQRYRWTVTYVLANQLVQWRKDGADPDKMPTADSATEAARALLAWQAAAQLTLPFGGFETRHDINAQVIDDIHQMYDSGMQFEDVVRLVTEKYGVDYMPLTQSRTDKFGGVPATGAAVAWLRKNEQFVADFLEGAGADEAAKLQRMQSLVDTIPELAYGKYDDDAAAVLRTMRVPGMDRKYFDAYKDVVTVTDKEKVSLGWRAENQITAAHEQAMAALEAKFGDRKWESKEDWEKAKYYDPNAPRGYTPKFLNARQKLYNAKSAAFQMLAAENPEWQKASDWNAKSAGPKVFNALETFKDVYKKPEMHRKLFDSNPEYWGVVDVWLRQRDTTIQRIAQAGSTSWRWGGKFNSTNDRVAAEIDSYERLTNKLRRRNTDFDDMFRNGFVSELYFGRGPEVPFSDERWIPRAWTDREREKRGYEYE